MRRALWVERGDEIVPSRKGGSCHPLQERCDRGLRNRPYGPCTIAANDATLPPPSSHATHSIPSHAHAPRPNDAVNGTVAQWSVRETRTGVG